MRNMPASLGNTWLLVAPVVFGLYGKNDEKGKTMGNQDVQKTNQGVDIVTGENSGGGDNHGDNHNTNIEGVEQMKEVKATIMESTKVKFDDSVIYNVPKRKRLGQWVEAQVDTIKEDVVFSSMDGPLPHCI